MEELKGNQIIYMRTVKMPGWTEDKIYRTVQLHSGDVLSFNIEAVKTLGIERTLKLGENIEINEDLTMMVTYVIKKTIQDKKWWQFWLKKQEEVTGYHLMVI